MMSITSLVEHSGHLCILRQSESSEEGNHALLIILMGQVCLAFVCVLYVFALVCLFNIMKALLHTLGRNDDNYIVWLVLTLHSVKK